MVKYLFFVLGAWKLFEEFHYVKTNVKGNPTSTNVPKTHHPVQPKSFLSTLLKTPVILPAPDAPDHRLTVILCNNCHANGLYQKIEQFVQQHVRWPKYIKTPPENGQNIMNEEGEESTESVLTLLETVPVNGPVAPLFRFLTTLIGVIQLSVAIMCVVGLEHSLTFLVQSLPSSLRSQLSPWVSPLQSYAAQWSQSRWKILAATFFLGTFLRSLCSTSKAFEIYLGQRLIFSKLASGVNPTLSQLVPALERAGAVILP